MLPNENLIASFDKIFRKFLAEIFSYFAQMAWKRINICEIFSSANHANCRMILYLPHYVKTYASFLAYNTITSGTFSVAFFCKII